MIIFQLYLLFFVFLNLSDAHNSLQKLGENDVLITYTVVGENSSTHNRFAIVKMYFESDIYPWAHLIGNEYLERPVHVTSARIDFNIKDARCVCKDAGHRNSKVFTSTSPLEFPADHAFGDESWTTTYFHCFTKPEKRPDLMVEEEDPT